MSRGRLRYSGVENDQSPLLAVTTVQYRQRVILTFKFSTYSSYTKPSVQRPPPESSNTVPEPRPYVNIRIMKQTSYGQFVRPGK